VVLALVHMDPDTLEVQGVWLSSNQSAYLRTTSPESKTLAQSIMDARGSAPTWDEWCQHLASKTPTVAAWQAIDRRDGEEPRHVLARAVAMEAVSRRNESS
jgi:hypothetical protein